METGSEFWELLGYLVFFLILGWGFIDNLHKESKKKDETISEQRKELREAYKQIEQLEEQLAFYENWIEQQEKQLDQKKP